MSVRARDKRVGPRILQEQVALWIPPLCDSDLGVRSAVLKQFIMFFFELSLRSYNVPFSTERSVC